MLDRIRVLLEQTTPSTDLCTAAYVLGREEYSQELSAATAFQPESNIWSSLRHYLGRLAWFVKAVKFVVRVAQTTQLFSKPYRVQPIQGIKRYSRSRKIDTSEFSAIVDRMFVAPASGQMQQFLDGADDIRLPDAFTAKFNEANPRSQVHAEIMVLEYFYANRLEFLGDDRYIGCSKPSCYCCQWYMFFHEMKIQPRPSHYNVWSKWSPAVCMDLLGRTLGVSSKAPLLSLSRQIERHISEHITADISLSVDGRGFESITDLSLSLPTIRS